MKKAFLVIALLLMFFWCINVKASDENLTEPVATDPEVAEIEKQEEEKVEEKKEVSEPVVKEEVKEEAKVPEKKEETKALVKAEPTRADGAKADDEGGSDDGLDPEAEALLHKNDQHYACVYYMNDYNGKKIREACTPEGTSSNKTFPTSQYALLNDFVVDGVKYSFKGWYDANGELVTEEKGVKTHLDSPDNGCYIIYLWAKWNEEHQPIYQINVTDKVSTGTHSWNNTKGHEGSYTYKFATPDAKTHYQLLYYKMEDGTDTYQPGDEYTHDISAQGVNTNVTEDFYAYWQADVTLDLYDENTKLISSESSFESVSINYNTDKVGYKFLGWFDADNKEVTETTFYPNEMGKDPKPVQVTLYAKYELILIDVSVAKEWNDEEDQDGLRPDSIDVTLSNGTKVTLNEENKWTATVKDVPEYEDGEKVKYTWTEETPEGYELTDTVLDEENNLTTLINTHIPKLIEITVTKVWADDENESGKRPESVTVALVVDEEEIDTVELNKENDWTHTFEKLPAYSNKEEIKYEVRELEVPEGYEVAYEETEDGYIIHNVLGQGEGEPDEPTYDNPQTGDNIGLYVLGLMTSLSGLVVCVKKYNFE